MDYRLDDAKDILSPSILVFHDVMRRNLAKTVEIAGDVARLRPHCKTHKIREIAEIQVGQGITKHKCATFAEAEMLVQAGATDVFLAYNMVGPNIQRACEFRKKFSAVEFSVTADDCRSIRLLSEAASELGVEIGVLLDLDSGQHRTGVPCNNSALELYRQIHEASGLIASGFHLYDGQNHQADVEERREAVQSCWREASEFKASCESQGLPVPRIVCGGTGSFPIFAELSDACIELSPGTVVYYDIGYSEAFPDLPFQPAALLFTRVVSRPTRDRVTLDLGYKAVASDPPAGQRVRFPALPDGKEVLQNEEHLVIETRQGGNLQPGDWLLAIPRHTCPTSALHKSVYVIKDGQVAEQWMVAARDRKLTI